MAYRQLLELELRSQGRVMSRPVSACTRVLAPLLLQDWEVGSRHRDGGVSHGLLPPCTLLPSLWASGKLLSSRCHVLAVPGTSCPACSCQNSLRPPPPLNPSLTPHLQHLKAEMAPDEFLHAHKRRLARMTLAALRQLHRRGRLMEGVLWQLNSYILNCLEKAGEAAVDGAQQEELG